MAEITIDTKNIVNGAIVVVLIIIALIVGAAAALFVFSPGLHPGTQVVTQTPIVEPTPTPTPLIQVTNPVTISSMTTSGGFPQINIKEDSRTFRVDWNTYDYLQVDDVVRFTIAGTEPMYGGTVYDATADIVSYKYDNSDYGFPIIYGPSVISSSNDYPVYYYDPSTRAAWQYDGKRSDKVSVKELRGQTVRRGRPPN